MKTSQLLGAVCAGLIALSVNVNAAIVDNGAYTTVDGVDWLDLTATVGMSYNDVSAQLGPGGSLAGWAYATGAQIEALWTAFGGDPLKYTGYSAENNGLFDLIAPYFGDLSCAAATVECTAGEGYSVWITADAQSAALQWAARSWDQASDENTDEMDYFKSHNGVVALDEGHHHTGSALIRAAVVPVPAAVWLFGSGLLGLVGMARRKKTA